MSAVARTLSVTGWQANAYRRMWRGSITVSFLNPLFFLVAIGVLLGTLVDRSDPDLGGLSYPVNAGDLRYAAHRIADYVYEKLTGEKGVFATRIAYVTKNGPRYTLLVADSDGENAKATLSSPEPIISPSWAPGGGQLAYVSFESRKPVIYSHDVATGKRRLLANFRGSNSAPSWSPDGRQVVATLSLSGNAQVYLMDANGGQPRRLPNMACEYICFFTANPPVWAQDGSQLLYILSEQSPSSHISSSMWLVRLDVDSPSATRFPMTSNDLDYLPFSSARVALN